jgi:acyl-CoA thioester hydrolase
MIQPAKIQVRFSDLDVLGHVNNNIYFSYFELARVHYFRELLGVDWDWRQHGIVLVKNEAEYIKSVLISHTPEVRIITENIGTKSFTLGYELTVNGEVFVKGRSVQVCYNAETQQTIAVPEEMKSALMELQNQ